MKNDSLNHGKKNIGKSSGCDLKDNASTKRSDDISSSGIEFHKPFANKLDQPDKK